MNMNIRFPTEITIDNDALKHLSSLIVDKSIFLITGGPNTKSSRLFKMTVQKLEESAKRIVTFDGLSTNPQAEIIVEAGNIARSENADCIISVGGGSVHDTAKLVSVLACQDLTIKAMTVEEQGFTKIGDRRLPVYTVPTIVGTGAEISPASLVRLGGEKRIVFSPLLYPTKAFYVPRGICLGGDSNVIFAGFDAFVQSLEAYLSNSASTWSDMFARAGIDNSLSALLQIADGKDNESTARLLSVASIQGLMAVSNSSVGAIHALSDPLSGMYDVHHGKALAIVASAVLERNCQFSPERCADVGRSLRSAMGITGAGDPKDVANLTNELIRRIAGEWWDARMKELPQEVDFDSLVKGSFNPDMSGNPDDLSKDDVSKIFETSLSA